MSKTPHKSIFSATWVRRLGLLLIDAVLIAAACYLALILRFDTVYHARFFPVMLQKMPVAVAVYLLLFLLGGIYSILWRYAGLRELVRLAGFCALSAAALLLCNGLFVWGLSRGVLCIMCVLVIALVGGSRMLWRMAKAKQLHLRRRSLLTQGPRLMIAGAGVAGAHVLDLCLRDPSLGLPILFVDNDPGKRNKRISNIPVRGLLEDIPELVHTYNIHDIIIAMPGLSRAAHARLVRLCQDTQCRVRVSQRIDAGDGTESRMILRQVTFSDLLARDEVQLDTAGICGYLQNRTLLVTGGGGSIGAELCRQILRFAPKKLIVFDIYENTAYELFCEARQKYGDACPLTVRIGDICDRARVDEVLSEFRPDVVFHAAAHKHVPLMEDSPAEAVKDNVFGTRNVLESAEAHGASRFVLISTDKAVNPTNVMGASKRVAELLVHAFAKTSRIRCMAVRFGNILGSHGSVIPLFEQQIRRGGPVTVTDPDITRFFMSIPEAARLVIQAGAVAGGGAICMLDMGEPVQIKELAEQLIRFHGYEPGKDIEIVYTGLRAGEKLYEELLSGEEHAHMVRTAHEKIMLVPVSDFDRSLFFAQLSALERASAANGAGVIDALCRMVPGFRPRQAQAAGTQTAYPDAQAQQAEAVSVEAGCPPCSDAQAHG